MNSRGQTPNTSRAAISGSAIAIGLLLTACHAPTTRVATQPVQSADVAAFRSIAFLPEVVEPAGREGRRSLTEALRAAVRVELERKGYVMASRAEADLLVTCFVNVQQAPDTGALNYSDTRWRTERVAPEEPGAPGPEDTWEIGAFDLPGGYAGVAVVIDVVDARTQDLVWRGWARRSTEPRDIDLEEIAEVTRAVLEEYPERRRRGASPAEGS